MLTCKVEIQRYLQGCHQKVGILDIRCVERHFYIVSSLVRFTALLLCSAIITEAVDFTDEIWVKVGAKSCIKCHKNGGDAEETRFILQDPALSTGEEWRARNWAMFQKVGKLRKDGKPLVLLKVTEEVEHEGGEIFKRGSVGYELLRRLVNGEYELESKTLKKTDFFAGVEMVDDQLLLRRLTDRKSVV